jgi:hypothetical protein
MKMQSRRVDFNKESDRQTAFSGGVLYLQQRCAIFTTVLILDNSFQFC